MFDSLLKPKFYSKCKSCAKLIKTRLETIQKKRNAVQKFLKKDIADLLRSGLDYNAYGRAEGLLVEQNMSSCYDLIAKFIGCVSDRVRDLYKQKDCPDECKEAIPSLMYAAARFSDLPELRELRTLFTEKFGSVLEPYISKEFVKKLSQDPPSKEMKIQLLRDLAQEFSIEWDNKALEQRLHPPPPLHEEKPRHDPLNDYDDEKWHKNNDVATPQGNNASDDETSTDNSSQDGQKACSSSLESVSEDEVEKKGPFSYSHVPPPYVKETFNRGESSLKKTTKSEAAPKKDSNHDIHEPVVKEKAIPRSVRRRPFKSPTGQDTVSDSKTDNTAKLQSVEAMDELLMHYSKKQSAHTKSGSGAAAPPERGISLPPKHITSVETLKGHGRATSLVPEMMSAARHVHPSLPDYDDFTARLAALRGR